MAGLQRGELRFGSVSLGDAVARSIRYRWSGPVVAAAVSAVLIALGVALPESSRWIYIAEGGPIENLAILAYAALLLALLLAAPRNRMLPSVIVVLLMTARELDLHKTFSGGSIFSLRTYTGDVVPFTEKLIAAVLVIAIVAFLVRYAVHYGPWLWRGTKSGVPAAYSIMAGAVLLFSAKTLDAFARTLHDLTGVQIHTGPWFQLIEEAFETAAPVVFLWTVFAGCGASLVGTAFRERPSPRGVGGEGSR